MPIDKNKIDELISNEPLSFSDALVLMMHGYRMKRGNHGDVKYVAIQKPNENSKMRKAYLYAEFQDGQPVPYTVQNDDLFADNWVRAD